MCVCVGGGGVTLYGNYIGFCPRIDFHYIMLKDCPTHDYFICDTVSLLPIYNVEKRYYVIGYLIIGMPSV